MKNPGYDFIKSMLDVFNNVKMIPGKDENELKLYGIQLCKYSPLL